MALNESKTDTKNEESASKTEQKNLTFKDRLKGAVNGFQHGVNRKDLETPLGNWLEHDLAFNTKKITASMLVESEWMRTASHTLRGVYTSDDFEWIWNDYVYDDVLSGWFDQSVGMKNILIKSLSGHDAKYSYIKVKVNNKDYSFLSSQLPDSKTGLIKINEKIGEVKPVKVIVVKACRPLSDSLQLGVIFERIIYRAQAIKRDQELNSKLVVYLKGYREALTGANVKSADGAEIIQNDALKVLSDILNPAVRGVLMSTDDNIGYTSPTKLNALPDMDYDMKEIARVKREPLTWLLGESPNGLNATGKSDLALLEASCQGYREEIVYNLFREIGMKAYEDYTPFLGAIDLEEIDQIMAILSNIKSLESVDGIQAPKEIVDALTRYQAWKFKG